MNKSIKIYTTIALFVVICVFAIIYQYKYNTCTEGGIAGNLNKCECVGLRVNEIRQRHPDGITISSCIGYLRK